MKDNMKLEMEAGRNIQLDHLNEFITNPQDCESIYIDALKRGNKDLVEENQRLKEQLDREIHINRKMKSCLSAFARRDNWKAIEGCADWLFLLDPLMAEETLKEIDNKE